MTTRIVAGLFAAIAALWLIFKGSYGLMTAVVVVLATIAYREFDHLFFQPESKTRILRVVSFVTLGILTLRHAPERGWILLWLPLVALCIRSVVRSNEEADFARFVRDVSLEMLGFLYVLCLLGFLIPIAESGEYGRQYLLLLFLIVFAGDTTAYFVGTLFGRHRLVSRLSPKKSVEGAIGAVAGALIAVAVWVYAIYDGPKDQLFIWRLFFFTPIGSALAQISDLFESMLKRSQAMKDSGQFLPGHGGLLDRIDGLMLSAPAFYFYLTFVLEKR